MTNTILVVDDKPNLRTLLHEYLAQEGFHVLLAENGRDALRLARSAHPDLILLDIMMPDMGGYEFIRRYRLESETPIICLTAKEGEPDKVLGLELGADDYITKPFGLRELMARIRAVLRRTVVEAAQPDMLHVSDVMLDKARRVVQIGDRSVDLTPSEFDMLAVLLSAPGHVFSRSALLEKLQGTSFKGIERTIDVHIRNLRRKVEPDPKNPRYILTVFGVGYRFNDNLEN